MVVDMKMINEVEVGSKTVSVKGRVISMSNISEFTSKSGYRGKRASCNIKDGNGDTIKVTFWTSHMKYFTKLSENDVTYIKKNYIKGDKQYGAIPLAKHFGVAQQTICAVVIGQNWKE